MKKLWFVPLALATALAITPAALADQFTYTFTAGDGSFTATGSLTGTAAGGGVYDITSGTIDLENSLTAANPAPDTGTGSLSGSTGAVFTYSAIGGYSSQYDNEVTPGTAPFVDGDGLLFLLSGGTAVNIFSLDPADYALEESDGGFAAGGTFVVTDLTSQGSGSATPEPSSLMLLGTGLFCLTAVLYRKGRSSSGIEGVEMSGVIA